MQWNYVNHPVGGKTDYLEKPNLSQNNLKLCCPPTAFWLTTALTALGVVVSFFGAQYLFCVVVRGPKVKGRLPVSEEGLHQQQQVHTNKFKSPTLAATNSRNSLTLALRTRDGTGLGDSETA